MIFVAILFGFVLFYFLVERANQISRAKRIKIRILVNGSRGKTTTTRLITKVLTDAGLRTLGRTTGSEARLILPSGEEEVIKRKRSSRPTELKAFFKRAVREEVEAVVVECSALRHSSQAAFGNHLVLPTHTVITNSFPDHLAEIGESREETAAALSLSAGRNSIIYTIDSEYLALSRRHRVVLVEDNEADISGRVRVHSSNLALAVALASSFNISRGSVLASAHSISGDVGLLRPIKFPSSSIFIPSFSINDEHSMLKAIEENDRERLTLIFSSRRDREYRIRSFERATRGIDCPIIIMGDYPKKVARYLKRRGHADVRAMKVDEIISLLENSDRIFLGLGNIKGDGERMIRIIKERYNA